MKKICILGSTGSIGKQTLEVVRDHSEQFEIVGLSALQSIDELTEQIHEFKPKIVAVFNKEKAEILSAQLSSSTKIVSGIEGLIEVATYENVDIVVTSVVGSIGLIPTLEAIRSKKTIALANKETLVVAGSLIMAEAQKNNVKIIPVDSEHSAIYQCLQGENVDRLSKVILTASGGPFRNWTKDQLNRATKDDALKHPNWSMGPKITIDSSTLMNKGLEVIEAKWLFQVDVDKIEVIVHPQSIIHSMIELQDRSVMAQLGMPDMKLPIQYALTYPDRIEGNIPKLDLKRIQELTFYEPDVEKFPCLALAYEALRIGGTMPCVLNGANEILVEYFLKGAIGFYDIPRFIEKAMEVHKAFIYSDLKEVLEVDQWVRSWVKNELR